MFEARNALKIAQLDNWEHGCSVKLTSMTADLPIKGETLAHVITEIRATLGCSAEDVQVNPCDDEPARIDAQVYERDDGYQASAGDMEKFKCNEIDLYLCSYSWFFEQVTRTPANFQGATA